MEGMPDPDGAHLEGHFMVPKATLTTRSHFIPRRILRELFLSNSKENGSSGTPSWVTFHYSHQQQNVDTRPAQLAAPACSVLPKLALGFRAHTFLEAGASAGGLWTWKEAFQILTCSEVVPASHFIKSTNGDSFYPTDAARQMGKGLPGGKGITNTFYYL